MRRHNRFPLQNWIMQVIPPRDIEMTSPVRRPSEAIREISLGSPEIDTTFATWPDTKSRKRIVFLSTIIPVFRLEQIENLAPDANRFSRAKF